MATIKVKTVPNARKQQVKKQGENSYKVWVISKPEKGRANKELITILKKHFKKDAKIISGRASRKKIVRLE